MRRTVFVPSVLVALVPVLSSCSDSIPAATIEACHQHSSRVSEGGDGLLGDRPEQVVTTIIRTLGGEGPSGVTAAVTALQDSLRSGDDGALVLASTAFAEACRAAGVEPPEG